MPSSERLVAVAAHGLAGSRTDLPTTALSDVEWFDLVQACLAADLVGFLAGAIAAGDLPTTSGQADELAAVRAEGEGLTRVVERRAGTMAALLAAAAIDHRVVDGPARRLAYADATARHFRSARVLVAEDRVDDALALVGPPPLDAAGRPAERRQRLVLVASVAALGGLRNGLDPDGSVAGAAVPEPGGDDLFGPAAVAEVEGRTLPALTVEEQLVATCVEVCSSPVAKLVDLRDIAELALSPGLDGMAARRLADAAQATASLAEGVSLAWRAFDLADKTDLSVWARRMADHRSATAPEHAAAPAARPGLAQRVFGRVAPPTTTPAAPGLPAVPAVSATTSVPTGPARSAGTTRR